MQAVLQGETEVLRGVRGKMKEQKTGMLCRFQSLTFTCPFSYCPSIFLHNAPLGKVGNGGGMFTTISSLNRSH